MDKLLIKNGRVWNGEDFAGSDILIVDGKIAGVGDRKSVV